MEVSAGLYYTTLSASYFSACSVSLAFYIKSFWIIMCLISVGFLQHRDRNFREKGKCLKWNLRRVDTYLILCSVISLCDINTMSSLGFGVHEVLKYHCSITAKLLWVNSHRPYICRWKKLFPKMTFCQSVMVATWWPAAGKVINPASSAIWQHTKHGSN